MPGPSRATTYSSILGFILLVAAGAGLALLGWSITKLPAPVTALLAGGLGFLASKAYESWRESRERLYDKKREVYSRLVAPWLSIQLSLIHGKRINTEEFVEEFGDEMIQTLFDAVLYASDDVLQLYGRLREQAATPEAMLVIYPRLLRAIRKDLGHTFTTMSEVDIMKLFVNFKDDELETYKANVARFR